MLAKGEKVTCNEFYEARECYQVHTQYEFVEDGIRIHQIYYIPESAKQFL